MKRFGFACGVCVLSATMLLGADQDVITPGDNLVVEGIPPIPAQLAESANRYTELRGASLLDFLDAERTYRANQLAYRQSLATYMTALEEMRQAAGTRNLP